MMKATTTTWIIVAIWIIGLAYCFLVPFSVQQDIPNSYNAVQQAVLDSFLPVLAAMLTGLFAEVRLPVARKGLVAGRAVAGIVVVSMYVLAVAATMGTFHRDAITAEALLDRLAWLRTRGVPIVMIAITYYFVRHGGHQ